MCQSSKTALWLPRDSPSPRQPCIPAEGLQSALRGTWGSPSLLSLFFPSSKIIPFKLGRLGRGGYSLSKQAAMRMHLIGLRGGECRHRFFFPLLNPGAMLSPVPRFFLPLTRPWWFPFVLCVVYFWCCHTMKPLEMSCRVLFFLSYKSLSTVEKDF